MSAYLQRPGRHRVVIGVERYLRCGHEVITGEHRLKTFCGNITFRNLTISPSPSTLTINYGTPNADEIAQHVRPRIMSTNRLFARTGNADYTAYNHGHYYD
jgi:hypothetical protein